MEIILHCSCLGMFNRMDCYDPSIACFKDFITHLIFVNNLTFFFIKIKISYACE